MKFNIAITDGLMDAIKDYMNNDILKEAEEKIPDGNNADVLASYLEADGMFEAVIAKEFGIKILI